MAALKLRNNHPSFIRNTFSANSFKQSLKVVILLVHITVIIVVYFNNDLMIEHLCNANDCNFTW